MWRRLEYNQTYQTNTLISMQVYSPSWYSLFKSTKRISASLFQNECVYFMLLLIEKVCKGLLTYLGLLYGSLNQADYSWAPHSRAYFQPKSLFYRMLLVSALLYCCCVSPRDDDISPRKFQIKTYWGDFSAKEVQSCRDATFTFVICIMRRPKILKIYPPPLFEFT